jgi:PAS domain S-box-containing protein
MSDRIPMSVLLWHPDPKARLESLGLLEAGGLQVVRPATEAELLQRAASAAFAAIVLDARGDAAIDASLQAARQLRGQAHGGETPLLFLTDGERPSDDELLDLGLADRLRSPIDTGSLHARLRLCCALRRARDGADTTQSDHLHLAVEAGALGLWSWDIAEDRVDWKTERVWQMFGLPRDATPVNTERFVTEFMHPEDVGGFQQALAHAFDSDQFDFEGRMYRRGELRWLKINGRVLRDKDGGPERMLGTIADITDSKRDEHRLRHGEATYRTLFDLLDEGACIIEVIFDEQDRPVDYLFVDTNAAFTQHTGLVDARGRRMRELVPDHDQHWFETYGHIAKTGEARRWQSEAKTLKRWFDLYASRIGGPNSNQVAVVFTDITAKKASEDHLRQTASDLTEADQRKTEFLATLAHELRNPLAPLRNALELLRRAGDRPDVSGRALEIMERQMVQMVHLVDDLLDVARIASGAIDLKKKRVDLKSIVSVAVETSLPLIEAGHHRFSVRLPEEELPLDADPARMTQVIGNLLNNAAKYTPSGGRIELMALRDGDHVVMTVSDDGIGIPKDSIGRVFDMFAQDEQAKPSAQGGFGVGLALVRRLVERHGGTVSVVSAGNGLGCLFTVRLPLAVAPTPHSRLPHHTEGLPPPASQPLRVLVADDNRDAAEALSVLLEVGGHTVRIAHDGDAALSLAEQFRPDIAFLDIGMPGRNGYEVAQALRDIPALAGMTLVALTGWSSESAVARTTAAGFDELIVKPAALDAVLDVMLRRVGSRVTS